MKPPFNTPQPSIEQAARQPEDDSVQLPVGARRMARMVAEHPGPAGLAVGAGAIGLYTAREELRRRSQASIKDGPDR